MGSYLPLSLQIFAYKGLDEFTCVPLLEEMCLPPGKQDSDRNAENSSIAPSLLENAVSSIKLCHNGELGGKNLNTIPVNFYFYI